MLWVSKFGIVEGQASEDTPWVGAFPDPSRNEEASDLYVIVHPALPGSEEFCAELRDAIGQAYHQKKVSLTGGMLRALKAAHDQLRDWNSRSLRGHQVGAGATLLAVRPERLPSGACEAYLAQAGPASAVFYRPNSEAAAASEIVPELPDAQGALGIGDEFWPQFTRYELADGDRLVILSPGPAASIGGAALAAMLGLPAEETVKALFRRLRESASGGCGAVLIAVEPDPVQETALQPSPPPASRRAPL
jgi:hypothetical protein